jgi:rubrerythrin
MTPIEALKLALEKEKASIALYTKLSAQHKAIKDLLIFLINEEMKHKKLIEDKMSELSRP